MKWVSHCSFITKTNQLQNVRVYYDIFVQYITDSGKNLNFLISAGNTLYHDWMTFSAWYSILENFPNANSLVACARGLDDERHCCYDWLRRSNVDFFFHKNVGEQYNSIYLNKLYSLYVAIKRGVVDFPLIVIDPDVVAVNNLSDNLLSDINNPELTYGLSDYVWFFRELTCESILEVINTYVGVLKDGSFDHLNDRDKVVLFFRKKFGTPEGFFDLCGSPQSGNFPTLVHYGDGFEKRKIGLFVKSHWINRTNEPPFSYADKIITKGVETRNEQDVALLWGKMNFCYNVIR